MAKRIEKGRAKKVLGRLDEASGALGDAREVCEEIGEAAQEEMHDCSMAMGIVEEVAAAIEANAEGAPATRPGALAGTLPEASAEAGPGAASEDDPATGWPLWRRRVLEAGGRGELVLALSFGEGYARFYDAAARFGGPGSEEAEILYWDVAEFAEEPDLLEGVLRRAAEHGARVVYERAHGRAAAHPSEAGV